MVAGKVKSMMRKRLRRMVESHYLTHKMALRLYRKYDSLFRKQDEQKWKSEFLSRIRGIDPDEYLDTSCSPSLNVIILVVDSLRNSHLSCQGYFRETTPFLDSLQPQFTAISASPWTYPSVASILTGLYPHNHNAVLAGRIKDVRQLQTFKALRGDVLTLLEMLFVIGYRVHFATAIDLAHMPFRGRVVAESYDAYASADDLLNNLTKWIAMQEGENFFAYVHLGDLHIPLNPSHGFRNFFGTVRNLPGIYRWDFATPEKQKSDAEKFREYRENRVLLYDNTLRYVDSAIERFYGGLEDMGLIDSSILVITADHGEEFWEHAELEARSFYHQGEICGISHGHSVFGEVIEVPLLMSGPLPERKGTGFVSTVDIVPTVVDLLGITHNMRFDGRNIFETDGERPLLSEESGSGYEKKALVVGRHKLIYSEDDGIEWLFDLEKDPQEQHPIVDREITSVFVEKLLGMLREDEKNRIREKARRKGLPELANEKGLSLSSGG